MARKEASVLSQQYRFNSYLGYEVFPNLEKKKPGFMFFEKVGSM